MKQENEYYADWTTHISEPYVCADENIEIHYVFDWWMTPEERREQRKEKLNKINEL